MSGKNNASQLPRWIALALLVILIDQLIKHLIVSAFDLGDSYYVTSFFSLVRAHNTGAAFSFLASAKPACLAAAGNPTWPSTLSAR